MVWMPWKTIVLSSLALNARSIAKSQCRKVAGEAQCFPRRDVPVDFCRQEDRSLVTEKPNRQGVSHVVTIRIAASLVNHSLASC